MVTVLGGFRMFQGAVPPSHCPSRLGHSQTPQSSLALVASVTNMTNTSVISEIMWNSVKVPEPWTWCMICVAFCCCVLYDPFPTMNKASVCWSICKVIPRRIWSIGWVTWVTWVTFGGWSIRWNPQCFIVPNCGPLDHEDLLLSLLLGLPTSSGDALQSAWRQALDGRHLMSGQLGCHPTPYNLCMVSQVPRFSLWHISPVQNLSKSF